MVEAKILIADDSEMNQQILSEILGGRYEYLMPTTACRRSSCCTPSLTSTCCSTSTCPASTGFGVLEVMKQRNRLQEIPVIITSSEDDESFIQKAYEPGVTDYIRRPFNLTVTQRRVSNALTLYARQKHLAEEQVYEHEKTNSAITDILLRQLVAATNRCPLSQARIPTRSDSSGPKAAGIDRSRRFLWNGAQNRKEAS